MKDCFFKNDTHYATNVVEWNFPGTMKGCNCIDTNIFRRSFFEDVEPKIYKDYCDFNKTLAGCEDIEPYPAKVMHNFYDENQVLCSIRLKNTNFYEKNKHCSNFDCFQEGVAQVEPITKIQITSDSNCLQLNDKKNICFERGTSEPIVEFTINEENVCLNNQDQILNQKHRNHVLLNKFRRYCKKYDQSFKSIDSQTEYDFFRINGADDIEQRVRAYELSRKFQYHIFVRGYIKWNCGHELLMDFYEINDIDPILIQFHYWRDSIYLSLVIIMIFLTLAEVKVILVQNEDILFPILRLIIYIHLLIILIGYVQQINIVHNIMGYYVDDHDCFVEPMRSQIAYSNFKLMKVRTYMYTLVVICSLLIVGEIFLTTQEQISTRANNG